MDYFRFLSTEWKPTLIVLSYTLWHQFSRVASHIACGFMCLINNYVKYKENLSPTSASVHFRFLNNTQQWIKCRLAQKRHSLISFTYYWMKTITACSLFFQWAISGTLITPKDIVYVGKKLARRSALWLAGNWLLGFIIVTRQRVTFIILVIRHVLWNKTPPWRLYWRRWVYEDSLLFRFSVSWL